MLLFSHSLTDVISNEWPLLLLIGVPVAVFAVIVLWLLFRLLWGLAELPRKDPES